MEKLYDQRKLSILDKNCNVLRKQGLKFLQSKIFLLELNLHMTIILNGMAVIMCDVCDERLTLLSFMSKVSGFSGEQQCMN